MSWQSSIWYRRGLLYNPREPNSWRSVLDAINRLATLREPTYVWRGHEDLEWALVPSIYRKLGLGPPFADAATADAAATAVEFETMALIERSKGHAYNMINGREADQLTHLALLQHSGAATPLLDVTTDPLVALYFACGVGHDDTDGAVLAVDARPKQMVQFDVSWEGDWQKAIKTVKGAGQALGIYSPAPIVTSRLMAQRGRFIFGVTGVGVPYSALAIGERADWGIQDLWALFGHRGPGRPAIPPVVAVRVAAKHKARLREVLDTAFGLNRESLFPDLEGFASAHGTSGARLHG